MKKTLAKWLLDVSKFIFTAILVTALFKGVTDTAVLIFAAIAASLAPLAAGLALVGSAEDEERKEKDKAAKGGQRKGTAKKQQKK